MLIETDEGVINTNQIVSAAAVSAAGKNERSVIVFTSGEKRACGIGIWELEQACGVIVPAQPGFTLIRAILPASDEENLLYTEKPVIAFRIAPNGTHSGPMPITVSGEPAPVGGVRWTIRQPNGRCFGPDGEHDTVDEFKAACDGAARGIAP